MQSRFFKIVVIVSFLLFVQTIAGYAQLSITGPVCVIAGAEYQYDIHKGQSDSSNMQLCITGGVIAGTDSACSNKTPFSFVRVIWRDTTQGNININTSQGNTSLVVAVTTGLQGGRIDSQIAFQTVSADSIPSSIHCSSAMGSSCSPLYQYQWQQSTNGMNWNNITNAVLQHLDFSAPISQSTYYRRRVTESLSGSINFSDIAVIVISTATTNTP